MPVTIKPATLRYKDSNGVYKTADSIKGDKGDPGGGVPSGGSAGQILKKASGTDYDLAWDNAMITQKYESNTLANIQTALVTLNGTLEDGQFKHVSFVVSSGTGVFIATAYYGHMVRRNATQFSVLVQDVTGGASVISGGYNSGTWKWSRIAPSGIPISSNTDLDDLKEPGFYYCASSSVNATLAHTPVNGSGFSMEVLRKGEYITQLISSGSSVYYRGSFSSGFTDWVRLVRNDELDNTNNITSGDSWTFTLANYGRCLLTCVGYADNETGMWILRRNGSSLYKKEISSASGISISMNSSGVVTITNNASNTVTAIIGQKSNVTI